MGRNGPHRYSRRAVTAWYDGLAPVEVTVECEGSSHQIRWERGVLTLLDHDRDAEEACLALGGDPNPCIATLNQWRKAQDGLSGDDPAHSAALWRLARGTEPATLGLPGELGRVVAVRAIVRCQELWDDLDVPDTSRQILATAMTARLREAVDATLAPSRGHRRRLAVQVRTRMLPPGEQSRFDVRATSGALRIEAELPLTWLTVAWGRGVASVEDHLVLDVTAVQDSGARLAAAAVHWEASRFAVHPVMGAAWVQRVNDGWSIDRSSPPPPRGRAVRWSFDERPY
jgi:hypothetical protein